MHTLVYTRNSVIAEHDHLLREAFGGADGRVLFRNASAHADRDFEEAGRVVVDDRFPHIAEQYRRSRFAPEVELFDANELDAPAPPEPEGDSVDLDPDDFASQVAHDAAMEAGLGPSDLDGVEPRGKTGYTTAQIRDLVD